MYKHMDIHIKAIETMYLIILDFWIQTKNINSWYNLNINYKSAKKSFAGSLRKPVLVVVAHSSDLLIHFLIQKQIKTNLQHF